YSTLSELLQQIKQHQGNRKGTNTNEGTLTKLAEKAEQITDLVVAGLNCLLNWIMVDSNQWIICDKQLLKGVFQIIEIGMKGKSSNSGKLFNSPITVKV